MFHELGPSSVNALKFHSRCNALMSPKYLWIPPPPLTPLSWFPLSPPTHRPSPISISRTKLGPHVQTTPASCDPQQQALFRKLKSCDTLTGPVLVVIFLLGAERIHWQVSQSYVASEKSISGIYRMGSGNWIDSWNCCCCLVGISWQRAIVGSTQFSQRLIFERVLSFG